VVAAARARERKSVFNPILADSSQCLQDAFAIRTSFKNFPPSGNFKLPDPPAGTVPGELTPEFLIFNKTYHNSLFALAGGLKRFHTIIHATQNILALVYRWYVGRILPRLVKTNPELAQPSKFARIQRTEYALTVFTCFLRPPVLGFVERPIPAETRDEIYRAFLGAKIEEYLKGEEPVAHCILQATVDYVNEWRTLFNETTNGKQASCAADRENDYPQCEYVVKAVDLMVLCQLFVQISRMRFPFPAPIPAKGEVSQEERQAALVDMVSSVSSTYYRGGRLVPVNWKETKVWGAKKNWVESVAIPACFDAKFLLQRAEITFKEDFERGDEQIDVGNRILLFLEIEKRLRPVLTCEHVEASGPLQVVARWTRSLVFPSVFLAGPRRCRTISG
jgi:hypothetical protein